MSTGGSISGVVGKVRWSYYVAAAINGYVVTLKRAPGQPDAWSLRANVVMADAFKLAQKPLIFEAPTAAGGWRWPIVDMDIQHGVMTATLGGYEEF